VFSLVVAILYASTREGDTQLCWALYPGALAIIIGCQQLVSPALSDLLAGSPTNGLLSSWGFGSLRGHTGDTGGGGLFHDDEDLALLASAGGGTGTGIGRANVSLATHARRVRPCS
jgi:hypothetical protein